MSRSRDRRRREERRQRRYRDLIAQAAVGFDLADWQRRYLDHLVGPNRIAGDLYHQNRRVVGIPLSWRGRGA